MQRWTDRDWRASAVAWGRTELLRLGYGAAGEPDQFHVRPWSTVFRVPTREGNVYLKAVPAGLVHEPAAVGRPATEQVRRTPINDCVDLVNA